MISIYDNTLGISVILNGKLKEIPKKRGYNEIETIRGNKIKEYIKSVINLNLTIDYIDEENYEKLKQLFLFSTTNIKIVNDKNNKIYNNYMIIGDTLSLEEYENFIDSTLYYKGEIILERI